MAKNDDSGGFPVGNQDPSKRGMGKPRPEREAGPGPKPGGQRGGRPGHGDVTDKNGKNGK